MADAQKIREAKKLLSRIEPSVNEKREFLDALHDDIALALSKGNSLRQIHRTLSDVGFTGSVMLLSAWAKDHGLSKAKPSTARAKAKAPAQAPVKEPAAPVTKTDTPPAQNAGSSGFASKAAAYDNTEI